MKLPWVTWSTGMLPISDKHTRHTSLCDDLQPLHHVKIMGSADIGSEDINGLSKK